MTKKDKEEVIDVQAETIAEEEVVEENQKKSTNSDEETKKSSTNEEINKAWKQVEEISKETWNSIQKRTNVVMVRMDDDSFEKIDVLVDAKVCKSRSEAAAYLISKGIESQNETFEKITELSTQIKDLRGKMYDIAKNV